VQAYIGPQETERLEKAAPGLELVVDYGWLKVLAVPIFIFLKWIHAIVGNWGWSIIILTIIIKLVFYPLNAKAGRSMAQMKVLAPKMEKLKQLYGEDRQKLNQAMMELYRTEKINPLGGCLPIVVQRRGWDGSMTFQRRTRTSSCRSSTPSRCWCRRSSTRSPPIPCRRGSC
jgi:YidC/Oxa1 family membrane protein insertase